MSQESISPKIEILYTHEDFYIIEKPSGLTSHGPEQPNLASLLASQNIEPWLCHRLDRETSGLMIIARSKPSANRFRRLFEQNNIEKYYVACSHKKGNKKQGSLSGFLKKARNGNWKLARTGESESTVQFFSSAFDDLPGTRIYLLKLIGGKTHQARVFLKANGSPILGDLRYGGKRSDRLFLHAYALKFEYQGQLVSLSSQPKFIESNGLFEFTGRNQPWLLPWPRV